MLKWREVTPFSRMLALILFLGAIPTLFFYLGMQYQDTKATQYIMRSYDFPRLHNYSASEYPQTTEESTSTIEMTQ